MNCPRCGLKDDYIPGGKPVTKVKNIRPADIFMQCGIAVSYDIQSGPIYCGDRATLIADGVDAPGIVAACKKHERGLRRMEHAI